MRPHDPEHEARLQARAEAPAGAGDPESRELAAYREVYAAIQSAPVPELPPGFAARTARRVLAQAEARQWEHREAALSRGALVVLAGCLLVSATTTLAPLLLGWIDAAPLLVAALAALGLVPALERVLPRRGSDPGTSR